MRGALTSGVGAGSYPPAHALCSRLDEHVGRLASMRRDADTLNRVY